MNNELEQRKEYKLLKEQNREELELQIEEYKLNDWNMIDIITLQTSFVGDVEYYQAAMFRYTDEEYET